MNVQELRIGNYFRDTLTGEWLLVDEVSKGENDKHFVGFFVINRNKFPLPNGWKAEPIPLTPDILEKAGFDGNTLLLGKKGVCSLDWHLCANGKVVNLAYDYDDCAYHSHSAEHNYDIKYLHQLQNLYFALTGKELEIKL